MTVWTNMRSENWAWEKRSQSLFFYIDSPTLSLLAFVWEDDNGRWHWAAPRDDLPLENQKYDNSPQLSFKSLEDAKAIVEKNLIYEIQQGWSDEHYEEAYGKPERLRREGWQKRF